MRIHDFIERYVSARDVSEGYIKQLLWFANALAKTGIEEIEQLTPDGINRHLRQCRDLGIAQETRRSRRRMACTLADAAADHGLLPPLSRRQVMRIGRYDVVVKTWSAEDVRRLLAAAETLKGTFPNTNISRRAYWTSYIRAGWESGLRGCDLRSFERDWISSTGRIILVQTKTRKRVLIQLRKSTLDSIAASFPPERALIWPRWGCIEAWRHAARNLVRRAGLAGSIGWLRSGCGTSVEKHYPGRGHERLGNTRAVFERHYLDLSQLEDIEIPMPEEL